MMNSVLHSAHYKFDDFLYSPTEAIIFTTKERIILKARENELLHILIKQHPLPVSREMIQETLWEKSYTSGSTINQIINALRTNLSDEDHTIIRTIPKVGYILGVKPSFIHYHNINKNSFSFRFIISWFIFCLFSITLGYKIEAPQLNGINYNEGNIHYLFEPNNIEKSRFSSSQVTNEVFIEKQLQGYQYCEVVEGGMECKNIM